MRASIGGEAGAENIWHWPRSCDMKSNKNNGLAFYGPFKSAWTNPNAHRTQNFTEPMVAMLKVLIWRHSVARWARRCSEIASDMSRLGKLASTFAVIALAFVPRECVGEAASSNASTNADFSAYLLNPPWIKSLRFVESRRYSYGKDPNKKVTVLNVLITNIAAIQPSGIFVEEVTPAPFVPKESVKDRDILGFSDDYFWISNPNSGLIMLSPRLREHGGSEKNGPQVVVGQIRADIERLRHLGLPALVAHSFKPLGDNLFEAVTIDGEHLHGKATSRTIARPLAIEYSTAAGSSPKIFVRYQYRSAEDTLP